MAPTVEAGPDLQLGLLGAQADHDHLERLLCGGQRGPLWRDHLYDLHRRRHGRSDKMTVLQSLCCVPENNKRAFVRFDTQALRSACACARRNSVSTHVHCERSECWPPSVNSQHAGARLVVRRHGVHPLAHALGCGRGLARVVRRERVDAEVSAADGLRSAAPSHARPHSHWGLFIPTFFFYTRTAGRARHSPWRASMTRGGMASLS